MDKCSYFEQTVSSVEKLERIAREIYDNSGDFPALNRNAKRILASVEMLRINLDMTPDPAGGAEK
jgi:hypothetical protein